MILFPQNYFEDNEKDSFVLGTALGRHILQGTTSGKLTWKNNSLSDVAIVAESITQNGYIKIACGLILQWGTYDVINYTADSNGTINLPVNFSNANYCLSLGYEYTSYVNLRISATRYVNVFNFICNTTFNGAKIQWFAIGY